MGAMLLLHGNLELSELLGIQRSFRFVVADLPRRSNEHLHHCRQGGVRNYDACDTFAICLRTLLSWRCEDKPHTRPQRFNSG